MRTKLALILLILILPLNSYAKSKSKSKGGGWLKQLETGVNIAGGLVDVLTSLEELGDRKGKEKHNIVYTSNRIYSKPNTLSVIEKTSNEDTAKSLRERAWQTVDPERHATITPSMHLKALELYKSALTHDANNKQTWHGYGWSLSELHRFKEAEAAFITAIDLGGTSKSWRYMGWNFSRQGKEELAIYCYRQALKKSPNNKAAKHALNKSLEILESRSSKDSIRSQSGRIYAVTYNKNGAVLKSTKNGVIYIGKDCDAFSKKEGKGTWGVVDSGLLITLKKISVRFLNQKLDLKGPCQL